MIFVAGGGYATLNGDIKDVAEDVAELKKATRQPSFKERACMALLDRSGTAIERRSTQAQNELRKLLDEYDCSNVGSEYVVMHFDPQDSGWLSGIGTMEGSLENQSAVRGSTAVFVNQLEMVDVALEKDSAEPK
jgi:hypothetical protein